MAPVLLDESDITLKELQEVLQHSEVDAGFRSASTSPELKRTLILDGYSLTVEDLVDCSKDLCRIELSDDSRQRITSARKFLEKVAAEHKIVYGITTGFGTFANVEIQHDQIKQLQLNLIRSHATGYGEPLDPGKARMLLALRINVLAKGHSGISLENVEKLIAAFNAYCVSFVPEQGTVGCSGDLCPLAHLALGLLGEGKMWSPRTGWAPAADVLEANGLQPMVLGPKEGLALINGTQMVSALGSLDVPFIDPALDYLGIAVHELAQMSERRLERLVNHELSGLPTFLTKHGGLNSGFMTVQLCAASLVSENKVLCHPSSADSIPTSCNQEDHVSMGGFSARKALKIVEHTEAVLAMELLAACQALEFLKPLKSTETLQKVYELVRQVSPALEEDRFMHPEIQLVIELVRSNKIWEVVEPHLTRMAELESGQPDVLRQEAESPTGKGYGAKDYTRVL
ncbi:Histidine ammonia-lyase [Aphelenchoides avenae]|nr:Histidine ammonia-lyase [Aphelenchus avenae]